MTWKWGIVMQDVKEYQNLIIGFGKAGKTLAGFLAKQGESVALVERSKARYGGTCINVACIPSKSLEYSARLSAAAGGDFAARAARYSAAIEEKRRLTAMLRQKNYDKVTSTGAVVLDGEAAFVDAHTVRVTGAAGESLVRAERIFINTGAVPFVPPIAGLKESAHAYTSETMMELDALPEKLVVIGGGYIGLEFASYYTNFGSHVTVVQDTQDFIPREDREVAARVEKVLEERGIDIVAGAKVMRVEDRDGAARLTLETPAGERTLTADAVLVATGRRPAVKGLNLEAAGVALTERGAIRTDERLRTSAAHIWALGDVAGGLQFTYISLDDFRIVKDTLFGKGERTTKNRGAVPYAVFLDPPLSRVGMTEEEARAAGYEITLKKLEAAAIPKAQVYRKPAGFLKAIVDKKTDRILGAHLFCPESQEMVNVLKLAIDEGIAASKLANAIYTHPTMTEAFNDLFA